ncbi:MAG: ferrous iron transport protein A [Aquificae bacterium]|nr:ferrous iron transport protein A [Aquificota bacterium]
MELTQGAELTLLGFKDENDPVVKRVKSMGFREGKKVKLLRKCGRVYLFKLDNARVALDEELVKRLRLAS